MVLKLIIFIVCFQLISCSSEQNKKTSLPQETSEEKGENLFILYCASCHGENGNLGSSGAKDLSKSILTEKEISEILTYGKNAMPPMSALLETKENQNLVISHVLSLRK